MTTITRNRNIEHWDAEDVEAWEAGGSKIAKRNLIWSIFAEHVGFSIWSIWSVMVLFMPQATYHIDAAGKFYLVALPTLVGAAMRIPYTVAPAKFGGRNWTIVSALLLLIPTLLTLWVMKRPDSVVHHLHGRGGVRGLRRRKLRVVDDQHQRVLPAAAQGLGAGFERGRRQHRRAGDPTGRPAGDRHGQQHRTRDRLRHLSCGDRTGSGSAPHCSWTTSAISGPTSARWPKR